MFNFCRKIIKLDKIPSQQGSTLTTVLVLLGITGATYGVTMQKIDSSRTEQRILAVVLTEQDLKNRLQATCDSLYTLQEAAK